MRATNLLTKTFDCLYSLFILVDFYWHEQMCARIFRVSVFFFGILRAILIAGFYTFDEIFVWIIASLISSEI